MGETRSATGGGWVRTRAAVWLARAFALAGLCGLVVYGVGRVMTDSTHWSQYLWWGPAIWLVGGAWACWAVSALAGRVALRPGGVMLRPVLLTGCVVALLWMLLAEWGMHRAVLGPREQPRERTLRVLHWNQSGGYRMSDSAEIIAREDADFVAIVNARFDRFRRETVGAMAGKVPGETELRLDGRVTALTEPGHFFSIGMTLVSSRERILRAGLVNLPAVDGVRDDWRTAGDTGFILWLEIEPGERFASLGRPLVVWVVDLPSDPALWRRDIMRTARQAVEDWERPALVCDERGRWRAAGDPVRVPRPDIAIGDYNTVRGSSSLRMLVPGMEDAFNQSGWGRARSWREGHSSAMVNRLLRLADWHIDLTKVGPHWRATGYRLIRPRTGPHKVQVADLILRD
ncbi:MAG: hypothetical protein LAT64_04540 [Phycisphaerales bacterium]|nr:hypothetical protein [Planctomycetota bacterium]MCH8508021.1 hypothetical protein [Phycisphaerales bacterium]